MTMLAADNPTMVAENRRLDQPLIVFAGGGTGGHLYPALAIRRAMEALLPDARFVFFGTQRAIDAQVLGAADETLIEQDVLPLTFKPWRLPAFLRAWRRSMRACAVYFAQHPPAVVIGTGGFASGPAVVVAAQQGVPTALLNPDLIPGRANRYLARRVDCVFAQWAESTQYLPKTVQVEATGCPIRAAFATATRAAGVRVFNLDPEKKVLLVTGASLGARSVNRALAVLAANLASHADWQVLHLTGPHDGAEVEAAYRAAGVNARTLAYTEHMAEAMAAADLIVSRAGASSLAEIIAVGKPAILVPYPHHRDRHQEAQARLVADGGAAAVVLEAGCPEDTAVELQRVLGPLLTDETRLFAMRDAAARRKQPDAAGAIAQHIEGWTTSNLNADLAPGDARSAHGKQPDA